MPDFSVLVGLLFFGGLLFLVMAALAPFETLGWWAGWFEQPEGEPGLAAALTVTDKAPAADDGINHFVVYLAGIDEVAGDRLSPVEDQLMAKLEARVPGTRVIRDVFPYSPANTALTGQRTFAWLWRWLYERRQRQQSLISFFINVRNMFQVAVAADYRYGPFYSMGSARIIRDGLLRHGYPLGSGKPVTIIGFSGGGSIALNAVTSLKKMIDAPIQVISLAGVLFSDPALNHVKHLFHLYGEKDNVQALGRFLFPSRWLVQPNSAWNRARAAGKISLVSIGPMRHVDPGGYYDSAAYLEDGRSHADVLLDNFVQIIQSNTFEHPDRNTIYFWRTVTGDLTSRGNPATSYEEALERIEAVQRNDRATGINPLCETKLLSHGRKVDQAIVYLHGFTNCPQQFSALGNLLFERGYNVLNGRIPHHGLADRLTRELVKLTAEELVEFTDAMVDIGQGLGDRVTVVGLSMGGVMAAWATQYRSDVAHSVIVAPSFQFRLFPVRLTKLLLALLVNSPDRYVWWDPTKKANSPPPYAYPGYSSRGLGEVVRLGYHIQDMASIAKPKAGYVTLITNQADMSVRNATAQNLIEIWRQQGYQQITTYEFPARLKLPHGLLDPITLGDQVDKVFPVMLDLITGSDQAESVSAPTGEPDIIPG